MTCNTASYTLIFPGLLNIGDTPSYTNGEYENLQRLLHEPYLMWEAIIEQNRSLVVQLRTTRCELHNLRSFMEFAGKKLNEQAMRCFRGIDSDTASEDELEDSKSEDEA